LARRWLAPIADPLHAVKGLAAYPRYWVDWYRYARLPQAEPMRLSDSQPELHERTHVTSVDAHYFYTNGWAMRRIVADRPTRHVDIGSQTLFANLLGAVVSTTFVDYRPLLARIAGLGCLRASVLELPFPERSIGSLSCLHVAEHIGLGRYGDPLDTQGTHRAGRELARVLAVEGNLYVALPVGRPRLCFNAHRIHAAQTIRDYFSCLRLVEFSGVHDNGRFVERVDLTEFQDSNYACGLFWFRRE
jgi:hypothetical protein